MFYLWLKTKHYKIMRRIGLLVTLLLSGAIAMAQTGKAFEKKATEAYKAKNYPKAFLDYSRAVDAYEAAGKTDTALYYNATIAGYKAKKFEELIPFATKAIELEYKKAHLAYYIKARAYKFLEEQDKYFETLKEAHKAYPDYDRISKKLALAYLKKGMKPYKEAAKIIEEAEPLRESNTEKYMKEVDKANKKFNEARVLFEKAYEANAKEEQVLKFLLSVYQNLEMKDKADKINAELEAL